VEQSDLDYLISADTNTYIDLDVKLYVGCKLISGEEKDLDNKDFSAVTNNFLHSVVSHCNIKFNSLPITQSGDLYLYRSYLETLLTYGSDAAASHLTNSFWYLERGDMLPCDPSTIDKTATATNVGFITRWDKIKQNKEVELYGQLHSEFCNMLKCFLPGVNLYIKLTIALSKFYLMKATADSKLLLNFWM